MIPWPSFRGWVWIGATLACIGCWLAVASWFAGRLEQARAEGREEIRALWRVAADQADQAERAEEQRRRKAQQEAQDAHAQDLARAAADAAGARAAADRLRAQLAAFAAAGRAARGDPAPAGGGAAAGDPIGVLADVLSRADERAGVLAAYADAARTAGQLCERSYDALMPPP